MSWVIILSGFTMGAAGSLHCVGMCGPLAFGLPTARMPISKKIFSLLLYNLGRVTTYASIGLLFGLLGAGFYLAGFQQQLSVISGILLLLTACIYLAGRKHYRPGFLSGFYTFIQQHIISFIGRIKTPAGFYLFGILNGLLPCGMIYMGVAAALSTGTPGESVLFMAMFGLGTLPAMLAFGISTQWVGIKYRRRLQSITPFFIVLIAVLLLVRGLSPHTTDLQTNDGSGAVHCAK